MGNDMENLLKGILNTPEGEKVWSRRSELTSMLQSDSDIKRLIETNSKALSGALARGDAAAIQDAVKKFVGSEDGAKIMSKLNSLFNDGGEQGR